MKCNNCSNDVSTVGEVRGCEQCKRNGTASAVHAKFTNSDTVEQLVADANPGAFPFEAPEPVAEKVVEPEQKPKHAKSKRAK